KTDTGNEDSSEGNNNNNTSSRKPVVIYGEDNAVLMRINFTTPVKDDNKSSRTIKNSDEVFTLQHRINNFSGIRLKESN
ncbi:MAG: hypothetical protein IJR43_01320, partial [Synergistaceae bacterium]|nr:hypothetical protein [Synergistaceae bacterium]